MTQELKKFALKKSTTKEDFRKKVEKYSIKVTVAEMLEIILKRYKNNTSILASC